jgi:hypothetical protein
MNQPTLFDAETQTVEAEKLVLYALGEFQARKKELAGRELPLDRLRGAFRRAAEVFATEELKDETLANELEKMGAKIVRVPSFVAKHPFRVTVNAALAEQAAKFYQATVTKEVEVKL